MNTILCIMLAATTVLRLELENETPYIVGVDGVRRQVCIVDPAEYAMMTGRVDQVWRTMNATKSGRIGLHGPSVTQEVDETNCLKTTVYKDGYRFAERFQKRNPPPKHPPKHPPKINIPAEPPRVSGTAKYREMVLERFRAKTAAPKTVTVEHDATTGKDEVTSIKDFVK